MSSLKPPVVGYHESTATAPAAFNRSTAVNDPSRTPFDGAKTYRVSLPKDIPAARFWSITAYDNRTRSMLQTPQLYPGTRGDSMGMYEDSHHSGWRRQRQKSRRSTGSPPACTEARLSPPAVARAPAEIRGTTSATVHDASSSLAPGANPQVNGRIRLSQSGLRFDRMPISPSRRRR
jgi:Protein of unknown function (DUF1214)